MGNETQRSAQVLKRVQGERIWILRIAAAFGLEHGIVLVLSVATPIAISLADDIPLSAFAVAIIVLGAAAIVPVIAHRFHIERNTILALASVGVLGLAIGLGVDPVMSRVFNDGSEDGVAEARRAAAATATPPVAATAPPTAAASPTATPSATATPTRVAATAATAAVPAEPPKLWTIDGSNDSFPFGVAHRDNCDKWTKRSGTDLAEDTGDIWYDGTPVLHAPAAAGEIPENCLTPEEGVWRRVTGWAIVKDQGLIEADSWIRLMWLDEESASESPATYASALRDAGCVPISFSLVVPEEQDNAWLKVRCIRSDEWEAEAFESAVALAVSETDCSNPGFSSSFVEEEHPRPTDLAPGNEVFVRCDTRKLAVAESPTTSESTSSSDQTVYPQPEGTEEFKEPHEWTLTQSLEVFRGLSCRDGLVDDSPKELEKRATIVSTHSVRCGDTTKDIYYNVTSEGKEYWFSDAALMTAKSRSSSPPSSLRQLASPLAARAAAPMAAILRSTSVPSTGTMPAR